MAVEIKHAICSSAYWAANQATLEVLYGVDGYYTDPTAWEAAQQRDLVTLGEVAIAEVYGNVQCATFAYSGWTASETNYAVIRPGPGQRHTGLPGTGAAIESTAYNPLPAFLLANGSCHIEGMDLWNSSSGVQTLVQVDTSTANLRGCLGFSRQEHGLASQGISKMLVASSGHGRCSGNIFHGRGATYGVQSTYGGSGAEISNCIVIACGTGFFGNGSTLQTTNCIALSCTTDFANSTAGSDYNASSGTGAPGANSIQSITGAEFADTAGFDYHLVAGSQLRGAGANLYPASTSDIDGDAWPTTGAWDIGADYYVVAETPSIDLAGAALATTTTTGTLTTSIPLAGIAASLTAADGQLTTQITLSGDAVAQAVAAAGLLTQTPLTGDGAAHASGAGELTIQIRLAGDALASSSAVASLTAGSTGLSGAAQALASAAGSLTTDIPLTGAALSATSAGGNITTDIPLASAAASVTRVIGSLDAFITLTGDAIAQALAAGSLTASIQFAGTAVATAAASGALSSGPDHKQPPKQRLALVRPEPRRFAVWSEDRRVAA